jgi:hypothetical protein
MTSTIRADIRAALGRPQDQAAGVAMSEVKLGDYVPGRGTVVIVDCIGVHTTLYFDRGGTLTLRNDVRLLVDRK